MEVLDKSTLEKLAGGDRDKDTMLVMYAPWCPFCQGLEPDYVQVAKDIGGANLRVAKYNADEDREYCKGLGLETFPTIVFMPKANDKVRAAFAHMLLPCTAICSDNDNAHPLAKSGC